jgi:putative Holliday junction resolvase
MADMIIPNHNEFANYVKSKLKESNGLGKIMAIDLGTKRLGIATAHLSLRVVSNAWAIEVTGMQEAARQVRDIITVEKVEAVVIGLPLTLEGVEGERVTEVQKFAERLSKRIEAPVTFYDERMTTARVHSDMKQVGLDRQQRHQADDASAASLILQDFLSHKRWASHEEIL